MAKRKHKVSRSVSSLPQLMLKVDIMKVLLWTGYKIEMRLIHGAKQG